MQYALFAHTILLEANPALISRLGRGARNLKAARNRWKGGLVSPLQNEVKSMRLKRDPATGKFMGSYGKGGSDPQSLLRNFINQGGHPMAQRAVNKSPTRAGIKVGFDIDGIRIKSNTAVAQELEKAHGTRIDAKNPNSETWKGHEMKPDWDDYNVFNKFTSEPKHGKGIPLKTKEEFVASGGREKDWKGGKYSKGFPWYAEGLWPALARHDIPIDANTGRALDKIHRTTGSPIINITGRPVTQPFKGENYPLQHAADASMRQAGGSANYAQEHTIPVGGPDKIKQLQSIGITDYIEDYPAEWKGQQAAGIRVHTFDLPWTREAAKQNSDVIVHKDMDDFANWVEQAAKKENKLKVGI